MSAGHDASHAERLARALRGSADGVFDWDLPRATVWVSARAAEILGYRAEDADYPAPDFRDVIHPDDLGAVRDRLREHFAGRGPFRMEFRTRRADGGWQWVRARGEATFDGAEPVRMSGTITDIQLRKETELRLRQSERRHALALQATSDGIYEIVVGESVAWISGRMAEILEIAGLPDGGMIPSNQLAVGLTGDDAPREIARFEATIRHRVPYDTTVARTRLDGSVQWLRARGFVADDPEGGPPRFIGAVSDVTADVQQREALRASEARVRQSQKMDALGTLASGIAHDFNNLLAVILGYVEIGGAEPLSPRAAHAFAEIGTAGRRARDLVQQILAFARRVEAPGGGGRAHVAEVVDEVCGLLAANLPADVRVARAVAPDVGGVGLDGGTLEQVLLNLAMNALHAMRGRGGVLEFGAERFERSPVGEVGAMLLVRGPVVRLWVRDTGVGIPAELLERVIEPFFTTKAHGEGTGLGLAVVHGIAQGVGGALQIASVEGEGTTVSVYLPAAASADGASCPLPTAEGPAVARRGRVLVVDDDASVAAMTAERLTLARCTVTVASGVAEAEALVGTAAADYDLVLTDWLMPDGGGARLLEVLRASERPPPIALMSGDPRAITPADAVALGARALLLKPVPARALLALLDDVLGREDVVQPNGTPAGETMRA